jgi:hypothetical protein
MGRAKAKLEGVLRSHLEEVDRLELGGVRYQTQNAASVEYPVEPTHAALSEATGDSDGAPSSMDRSGSRATSATSPRRVAEAPGRPRCPMTPRDRALCLWTSVAIVGSAVFEPCVPSACEPALIAQVWFGMTLGLS